jgi:hypothetical protein
LDRWPKITRLIRKVVAAVLDLVLVADQRSAIDLKLLDYGDAQGLTLVAALLAALFACIPRVEQKRANDAGKADCASDQGLEVLNPGS